MVDDIKNSFYSIASFNEIAQKQDNDDIDINADGNVKIISNDHRIDIDDDHYGGKKVEDGYMKNMAVNEMNINININHVPSERDSNQFHNNNNNPFISNIDFDFANKKKGNVFASTNENEIFIIEEHIPSTNVINNDNMIKAVDHNDNKENKNKQGNQYNDNNNDSNSDNDMEVIPSMAIQSFRYNETINVQKSQPQTIQNKNENIIQNQSQNKDIEIIPQPPLSPNLPSHFIIEELSERTDYIIGTYKPYQIIFYNSNTKEHEPKCERRYDNFNTFYSKIIRKYPYIILPKLSQKKMSIKLISDNSFLKRRQKQLTFLINYIHKEDSLFSLPDIQYFINSIEFHEKYYKSINDEFINDLHIKNNTINKLKSTVFGYFGSSGEIDDNQSKINKIFQFYSKMTKAVKKMRDEIKTMSTLSNKTAKNYEDIANDLLFIRDVKDIQRSEIEFYNEISTKLSNINNASYEDLYDQIDNFTLLLQGLVEMLKRYSEFMNRLKLIRETYKDYMKNPSNYNCDVSAIKDKAEEKKALFEEKLFSSLDHFISCHGKKYPEIISDYKKLLFECNYNEMTQLKTVI